jgi:hypothetical protein
VNQQLTMDDPSIDDAERALAQWGKLTSGDAKDAVAALLKRQWSLRAICLGARAHFRCEYCGLDLLASVDAYRAWQEDHIIPKRLGLPSTGDTYALACLTCNVRMKGRWNPLDECATNPTREELLHIVRQRVASARMKAQQEIADVRAILRLPPVAT